MSLTVTKLHTLLTNMIDCGHGDDVIDLLVVKDDDAKEVWMNEIILASLPENELPGVIHMVLTTDENTNNDPLKML